MVDDGGRKGAAGAQLWQAAAGLKTVPRVRLELTTSAWLIAS